MSSETERRHATEMFVREMLVRLGTEVDDRTFRRIVAKVQRAAFPEER